MLANLNAEALNAFNENQDEYIVFADLTIRAGYGKFKGLTGCSCR
jgi:hypothetical protein